MGQRSGSPEDAVARFVADLDRARLDPAARRLAFEHLSNRSREALRARASRASQVSGWAVEPWEMLAPGRVRFRIRFDRARLHARVAGDRAVVTARGSAGGVADIPLVFEDARWRVDLDIPPMRSGGSNRATP